MNFRTGKCSTLEKKGLVFNHTICGYFMADAPVRFDIPETLFQTSLLGLDVPGIHDMLYNSVCKCDHDLHRDLFGSVVFAGGSTMFPGIADRMRKELKDLVPSSVRCVTVAPPERKYSAWIGGSIVASLNSFRDSWCSKLEYEEYGPTIVHRSERSAAFA